MRKIKLIKDLEDLQVEIEDFIEDMDSVQNKFSSRSASYTLEDYMNKKALLKKRESILLRFKALQEELEVEVQEDGELEVYLSEVRKSIKDMNLSISNMKGLIDSIGVGLVPKKLERFSRRFSKEIKSYFLNPREVVNTKKHNMTRSGLIGAEERLFFQTVISIKGLSADILLIEPVDGDYKKKMPTSGNVFWEVEGRAINTKRVVSWLLKKPELKGRLTISEPLVEITKGAVVELLEDVKGRDILVTGSGQRPDKYYDFRKGTKLKLVRVRGGLYFTLKVIKLVEGSRSNEVKEGDVIEHSSFGYEIKDPKTPRKKRGWIMGHWGKVEVLTKYIKVINEGSGARSSFDPGN